MPPSSSKNRRSASPVGRFRSVFKSKKSPAASIASTDSHSPERQRPVDLSKADTVEQSNKSSESSAPSVRTTSFPSITVADSSASSTPPSSSYGPTDGSQHQPDTSKVTPNERFRRLSRGQKVDTTARPETPPANEKATPVIVNTPPTPTDPSHPNTIVRPRTAVTASPDAISYSPVGHSNGSSPASVNHSMIAQRRSRAGSASLVPSKLSNFTLAPLTPTPESGAATPSASGFFSSVLSAAQNATNSLSNATNSLGNTIASTNLTAPWSNSSKKTGSKDQDDKTGSSATISTVGSGEDHDEVEVESSLGASLVPSVSSGSKEPAVKTLGMGDLSLSQLGIAEQPKSNSSSGGNSAANSANNSTAAMANSPLLHAQRVSEVSSESRHRSESAPADSSHFHATSDYADHGSDAGHSGRPGSVSDFAHDDRTPPTGSLYGDKEPGGIQRTGSIRSAIGRRRHRGSSAVSGGTIAAAIAAANASLAHPAHGGSTPKLTGFAVASKKRNRDFHSFFKSVPDDDYLIEDYSCALQREILAHGRLYVSEGHLCFSSNILGWVTTLVMSFDEIVSVEKRSTALVFKNGLMISTLHAKHIFASFASRDSTYDLIVKIWKLGHPSLQSSLNGVRIDETGGDKTEKIDEGDEDASTGSRSDSESDDDSDEDSNDFYDEDAEDEDAHDVTQTFETNGGHADADAERTLTRKVSGAATAAAANGFGSDKPKDAPAASASADFPGPITHSPTDCGIADTHYDKGLIDEVIPAPLGKVFSYIFGTTSVTFMAKWLSNDQKCFDIQMPDKKGLSQENKSRTFSYIKPLNAAIGPRQTKCIVTEQIDLLDFEKAIHIVCSTQNPDVPSGNVFTVKTNYCLSWAEGNSTRMQMTCTTEWSGKSWLKGPIEKAANDGQAQYGRDLLAGLKEAVSTRPRAGTGSNGAAGAGKGGKAGKKSRKGKAGALTSGPASDSERSKPKPLAKSDWGLLEPVHGILGPAVDIVKPLLTGNVMYGLLVGLLVASWFRFGFNGNNAGDGGAGGMGLRRGAGYPDRLAAYEEMWQREESELWDWLEERVGLDRLMDGGGAVGGPVGHAGGSRGGSKSGDSSRKRAVEPRTVEEKLHEERMDDREIREAIRVTEEKLQVLKQVVDKREKVPE